MAATALKRRTQPTQTDVLEAISELHDCLHTVERKVDGVVKDVGHVRERVSHIEGYQSGIAAKVKAPAPGETISFWERWKTPIQVVGAVLGALTAFVAAYPILRGLLLTLDAYLSSGQ